MMQSKEKINDNARAGDIWLQVKLLHRNEEGFEFSPRLIPGLSNGDILQVRSTAPNASDHDYILLQFTGSESADARYKDKSIVICSKTFESRKSFFPNRSDVLIRKVEKYQSC